MISSSVAAKPSLRLDPTRARTVVGTEPLVGPAILEAYDTTIVLPPDASARSDGCGSIVIDVPDSVMES